MLPLPARGERVGVRGLFETGRHLQVARKLTPRNPRYARLPTSPRKRGEVIGCAVILSHALSRR